MFSSKIFRTFFFLFLFCLAPSFAQAAARFWVGGSGTWDNSSTTHWATTSGGSSGAAAPTSADVVTFDGNSGASAVITVNANVMAQTVGLGTTGGNFTGTLDFATNNNSPTFGAFAFSGSGTRTLNMGGGTWTITGLGTTASLTIWDMTTVTGLTLNPGTSTLALSVNQAGISTFIGGAGLSYNIVTMTGGALGPVFSISGSTAFANWSVTGPAKINILSGATVTVSNAFSWTGTVSQPIVLWGTSWASSKISVASGASTMTWANIATVQFIGGGSFSASNSFDAGGNSGISISNPSVGGGGSYIIGGG